jgi:hypothetical protein
MLLAGRKKGAGWNFCLFRRELLPFHRLVPYIDG